jgi:WD40 repeat protein/energy-coupling factor transporter ATP-binding protein EcfA2
MPQPLRIFVSSPGDVANERLRADLIVDKLAQDYSRFFTVTSYRWEHEPMLASKHFQDAIEPPSAFDIVILILWSRLGTPLPEKTDEREYRGIDGRAPVTGTEWEYEEALKAAREKRVPDLLAFRNVSPAPIDTADPKARAISNAQLDALDRFWRRHFADRGIFLAAYDEYRTLEDFGQRLEQSLRKLIERRIKDAAAGDTRAAPIWLGEPFRGLESYEFEHSPIFFGKDGAITKATENLAGNASAGRAFLLVSGPSGSGKSSLVKAGVIPRLMKPQRISGMAFVRRVVFRTGIEGADVFLGLAKALMRTTDDEKVGLPELISEGQSTAQLAAFLRGSEASFVFANALGRLTETGRASHRLLAFEQAKLVLVIDQLEELFTVSGISANDQRQFVRLLAGLAHSGAVWVIATMRADFWPRGANIPELIALAEGTGRIDLVQPSSAELSEMIRKPSQAAGLAFEVHPQSGLGLDAVLAQDAAGAPGVLPLLSFTLDELYKDARTRGEPILTYTAYEALGGLEGAIAKRADQTVSSLPPAVQAKLPRVLRALTTVAGTAGQAPVGRLAALGQFEANSPERMLIDRFITARLLVAAGADSGPPTVRLAHEALINGWQTAHEQLAVDRRDLETRTLIERQYARWNQVNGWTRWLLLLRNPDLASAVDLAKRWDEELDAALRKYIRRSSQRARLTQTLTAAAAILFALVAGAAFYAEQQVARAQKETEASLFIAQSELDRTNGNIEQAVKQAKHAYDLVPSETSRSTLLQALMEVSPNLSVLIPLGTDGGDAVVWINSDQLEIATVAGRLNAFDIAAPTKPVVGFDRPSITRSQDGNPSHIRALSSLGDGRMLAVFDQGTIGVYGSGSTTMQLQPPYQEFSVNPTQSAVAVGPGGRMVALAGVDDTVILYRCDWSVPTHTTACTVAPFAAVHGRTVAISADEKRIAVGDATGKVSVYDMGGNRVGSTDTLSSPIISLAWDGQRNWLAAGTSRGEVAVFDSSIEQMAVIAKHTFSDRPVTALVWNPKEPSLAFVCSDRAVCLWRARDSAPASQSFKPAERFEGHRNAVTYLSFSPDGERLASASADGTIRVWSLSLNNDVMSALYADVPARLTALSVSPDRQWLAAGGDGGVIELWNAATKAIDRLVLAGNDIEVRSLAWSRAGAVAALTDNNLVDVIPVDVHQPTTAIPIQSSVGFHLAWTAADQMIAVPVGDKGIILVDPRSPEGGSSRVVSDQEGEAWAAVTIPDTGQLIASYGGGTIKIWDLKSNTALGPLKNPTGDRVAQGSLAAAPDGRLFATSSSDGSVPIYETAKHSVWQVLKTASLGILAVAFSPDGKKIAALGNDNQLYVWTLSQSGAELFLSVGVIPRRAIVGDAIQRNEVASWVDWLANDRIAVSTGSAAISVFSIEPAQWLNRVDSLALGGIGPIH